MRPFFSILNANYPRSEPREKLFARIGWSDLVANQSYKDTCAIRMSVALLSSGVILPGARMKANAGTIKGRYIEPGQGKLSQILRSMWGAPEIYRGMMEAQDGIGQRSGVVSFFRIYGQPTDGGHIDLVHPGTNGYLECARSCFFMAVEVWFWPLRLRQGLRSQTISCNVYRWSWIVPAIRARLPSMSSASGTRGTLQKSVRNPAMAVMVRSSLADGNESGSRSSQSPSRSSLISLTTGARGQALYPALEVIGWAKKYRDKN
jgi:hypothetical protein